MKNNPNAIQSTQLVRNRKVDAIYDKKLLNYSITAKKEGQLDKKLLSRQMRGQGADEYDTIQIGSRS